MAQLGLEITNSIVELEVQYKKPILEISSNVIPGRKGDKGDKGDIGFSGNIDEYEASTNIQQYKLLTTTNDGKVVYASSDNQLNINKILGMSRNSALSGDNVLVTYYGKVENPLWNLNVNLDVFLGLNGDITQDPFTGVFTQSIGYAVSPTTIYINIKHGILRI